MNRKTKKQSMDEEIKKTTDYIFERLDFLVDHLGMDDKKPYDYGGWIEEVEAEIKDKLQELYLQGAKDMWKALEQGDPTKTTPFKAQQFIDSLEKDQFREVTKKVQDNQATEISVP